MPVILELLIIFLLPAGILQLIKRFPLLRRIGAIALCYVCGFILSVLPISYDKGLSQMVASVLVALAIPLILFGFDLRSIRSLARDMLIGYGLQVVSAIVCAVAAAVIAARLGLAHTPQLAGMAIGLYTGGTPNLIAVGNALIPAAESAEVIAAANTADFFVGGSYFLLILTIVRTLYRSFLGEKSIPDMRVSEDQASRLDEVQQEYDYASIPKDRKSILRLVGTVGLAVACLGIGAGLEMLINGSLDGSLYIMITVSILGIAASFIRPIREVRGTYQVGQYLVLVFSLGLSMSIDLGTLVREILPTVAYFACVQTACVLVHLILCKLFRIDGGTALITNSAGIYGPPFIAPIAEAYGDRRLIAPGIICAITGLVVGNLLGIGIGGALSFVL